MGLITTKICKASDIGINGNLFGGTMMSWLDEAGAIFAARIAKDKNVVTLKISEVLFKKPVKINDHIEIYGTLVKTGKSSMTIELVAARLTVGEKPEDPNEYPKIKEAVCTTTVVFVRIGEDGHSRELNS